MYYKIPEFLDKPSKAENAILKLGKGRLDKAFRGNFSKPMKGKHIGGWGWGGAKGWNCIIQQLGASEGCSQRPVTAQCAEFPPDCAL